MSPIISFLDHDHVVRLVEIGLKRPDAADDAYVRALFAPDPVDLAALRAMGCGLSEADGVTVRVVVPPTPAGVAGSSILVSRRGPVTAAMISACPDLRLVQRLGERRDGLDVAAIQARGVPLSCLPRPSMVYTAEHALLLMLALAKKLIVADRLVRAGGWDAGRVQPADNVAYNWAGVPDIGGLHGRTLGIIGLGEVGLLLARRAIACGMRVLYSNRRCMDAAREAEAGVAYAVLDELLARSDFVVLAAANHPENDRLLGAAQFARMQPSAFFVNVSRGRMVDEDALFAALTERRIAGAGLDVHRIEPRQPDDRFAALDNVILTPHLAGGSRRHLLDEVARIYDNFRAALTT